MSRSATAQLARHSTNWLLLVLCIALLAWRIDFRVEQCHASTPSSPAVVAYFDVNERGVASLDETHLDLHTHVVDENAQLRVDLHSLTATLDRLTTRMRRSLEKPPVASGPFIHPVSTFPNPPPSSLA